MGNNVVGYESNKNDSSSKVRNYYKIVAESSMRKKNRTELNVNQDEQH